MLLQHMSDKLMDLPTQMNMLSRTTTNMLLETLRCTDSFGEELYNGVISTISMDWDDATHKVHTEFIPSVDPIDPDHTRVEITVENTYAHDPHRTITLVLSVILGHMRTEYHTRYIPTDWDLDVTKTVIAKNGHAITYDVGEFRVTTGMALAALRCLAIQLGATLEIANNPLISPDAIAEYRTCGMPEFSEMGFLRHGMIYLMRLIQDAAQAD